MDRSLRSAPGLQIEGCNREHRVVRSTSASRRPRSAELAASGGRGGPAEAEDGSKRSRHDPQAPQRWRAVAEDHAEGGRPGRPPKVTRSERATWTTDQLRTFLVPTKDDRLGQVWRLFATTGMRRGGVLGLRRSDVDLESRRLTIVQTVTLIYGEPVIGPPKSARSARTISLDPGTASALGSFLSRQRRERLERGPRYEDSGFVTCNGTEQPSTRTGSPTRSTRPSEGRRFPRERPRSIYNCSSLGAGSSRGLLLR
jgi:integrase